MARHQIPRHLRRRLVAAGTAAVCILGAAVGIGIYGAASAEDEATRPVPCLPDVPPPASSEAPAPEEPPAEEPPAEEPPAEEPPAEEPPAEEPPAEEQPTEEAPAEETATQGFGQNSVLGARPRGQQPTEEAPTEEPPAETPPAEEPPAEEQPPGEGEEQGPPPPETVPPVDPEAPEDDFGNEDCTDELGPFAGDFVSIFEVEPNNLAGGPEFSAAGSRGTFVTNCGNNEDGHFNSDNFIAAPGKVNGAEHTHDYVGNAEATSESTNESLVAAETTCENGDQSAYFWPVIRVRNADGTGAADETNAHNFGEILRPTVRLEFRGSAQGQVVAMPQFIRVLTGNAKSESQDGVNQNAKWTCTGFEDRITDKYPLCPRGSQLTRIQDFPSCWDGENTDSANHRDHIVFPDEAGTCPEGTVAVPALRITLNYAVPRGRVFAVDSFPAELHSPITEHSDFVNVMPVELMDRVVQCVNSGRRC
ncbi:DUF1996 domain-containing protein [Actinophytocola sediminis]